MGQRTEHVARARLAANLRPLIEARGWSITGAAARLGIARRSLQSVLAEERNVGIDMLDVFSTLLSIQSWHLLAARPVAVHVGTSLGARARRPAKMALAQSIRARAWRLSLSFDDIAHDSGCSRSGLYNVLAARVSVGIDLLPPLARVLRTEMHSLVID